MTQAKVAQKTGGLALIAVGSNQRSKWGDPEATVRNAIQMVGDAAGKLPKISGLYLTPAFPSESSPDFVNAACVIDARNAPSELLSILHGIEEAAGRTRDRRWGARTLDLDLIALGDRVLPDAATQRRWMDLPLERQMEEAPTELILPHPRLQDRAFVLVPLADVAPDWRHPVLGRTIRELLADLPAQDRAAVKPL